MLEKSPNWLRYCLGFIAALLSLLLSLSLLAFPAECPSGCNMFFWIFIIRCILVVIFIILSYKILKSLIKRKTLIIVASVFLLLLFFFLTMHYWLDRLNRSTGSIQLFIAGKVLGNLGFCSLYDNWDSSNSLLVNMYVANECYYYHALAERNVSLCNKMIFDSGEWGPRYDQFDCKRDIKRKNIGDKKSELNFEEWCLINTENTFKEMICISELKDLCARTSGKANVYCPGKLIKVSNCPFERVGNDPDCKLWDECEGARDMINTTCICTSTSWTFEKGCST